MKRSAEEKDYEYDEATGTASPKQIHAYALEGAGNKSACGLETKESLKLLFSPASEATCPACIEAGSKVQQVMLVIENKCTDEEAFPPMKHSRTAKASQRR